MSDKLDELNKKYGFNAPPPSAPASSPSAEFDLSDSIMSGLKTAKDVGLSGLEKVGRAAEIALGDRSTRALLAGHPLDAVLNAPGINIGNRLITGEWPKNYSGADVNKALFGADPNTRAGWWGGLATEVIASPSNFIGIGALTKLGKGAGVIDDVVKSGVKIGDALDMAKAAQAAGTISKGQKSLLRAVAEAGENAAPLAKSWGEQGKLGQRALVQVGLPFMPSTNRTLIQGSGALQGLQNLGKGIRTSKTANSVMKHLDTDAERMADLDLVDNPELAGKIGEVESNLKKAKNAAVWDATIEAGTKQDELAKLLGVPPEDKDTIQAISEYLQAGVETKPVAEAGLTDVGKTRVEYLQGRKALTQKKLAEAQKSGAKVYDTALDALEGAHGKIDAKATTEFAKDLKPFASGELEMIDKPLEIATNKITREIPKQAEKYQRRTELYDRLIGKHYEKGKAAAQANMDAFLRKKEEIGRVLSRQGKSPEEIQSILNVLEEQIAAGKQLNQAAIPEMFKRGVVIKPQPSQIADYSKRLQNPALEESPSLIGRAKSKIGLGMKSPSRKTQWIDETAEFAAQEAANKGMVAPHERNYFKNQAAYKIENEIKAAQSQALRDILHALPDEASDAAGISAADFIASMKDKGHSIAGLDEATQAALRSKRVNKDVAERLIGRLDYIQQKPGEILGLIDKTLNLYKSHLTQFNPAFHGRNLPSNIVAGAVNGNRNPKTYSDALEIQRGASKGMTLANGKHLDNTALLREFYVNGIIPEGWVKEMAGGADDASKIVGQLTGPARSRTKVFFDRPWVSGHTGLGIETNARIAFAVDMINKGETNFNKIGKKVGEVFFDYGDLTRTEKDWMRRIFTFYCVPEDCEILTRDGWKRHDQILPTDEAYGYDVETDTAKWTPILEVSVFDYNGHLMTFGDRNGTGVEFLFTMDHRWPITMHNGKRKIVRSYQLRSNHKIPYSAPFSDWPEMSDFTPDEAAILGWLFTDGHFGKQSFDDNGWYICQSEKKFADEIRQLLNGRVKREYLAKSGVVYFYLTKELVKYFKSKGVRKKTDAVSVVKRLNKVSATAMWDAMYKGDGITAARNCDFYACQKYSEIFDAAQMLVQMLGPSHMHGTKRGGYISKTRWMVVNLTKIRAVWYTGKIWCPKTGTGTWLMRRNGRVIFTGNTWGKKNTAQQARMMVQNPASHMAAMKLGGVMRPQDRQDLPEYSREGFGWQFGKDKKGDPLALTNIGVPQEPFLRGLGSLLNRDAALNKTLSSVHPLAKMFIEGAMGTDTFTGRKIKDMDKAGLLSKLTGQTFTDDKGREKTTNPQLEWLLRNTPASRYYGEANKLFMSDQPAPAKALSLLTGLKTERVDADKNQYVREKKAADEYWGNYERRGIVNMYGDSPYMTEDQKKKNPEVWVELQKFNRYKRVKSKEYKQKEK